MTPALSRACGFRADAGGADSAAQRRNVVVVSVWGVPHSEDALGDLALLSGRLIINAVRQGRAP